MPYRKIYILVVAVFLGMLIVAQTRTFSGLNDAYRRDSQSNVFNEIKILKDKNSDLRNEIFDLESTIKQLDNQNLTLASIDDEIKKYKTLNGESPIFGHGVIVTINGQLTTPWIVDLINEFYNSGAQAVSANGIRITNKAIGFDTMPQGQILLNGSILSSPYVFGIIGEASTIINILELPQGIFDRVESVIKNLQIKTDIREIIQMQ